MMHDFEWKICRLSEASRSIWARSLVVWSITATHPSIGLINVKSQLACISDQLACVCVCHRDVCRLACTTSYLWSILTAIYMHFNYQLFFFTRRTHDTPPHTHRIIFCTAMEHSTGPLADSISRRPFRHQSNIYVYSRWEPAVSCAAESPLRWLCNGWCMRIYACKWPSAAYANTHTATRTNTYRVWGLRHYIVLVKPLIHCQFAVDDSYCIFHCVSRLFHGSFGSSE